MTDEMELDKLGEEKIAVFAVIPDTHTSYNFLVSILYTQIFQNAFYRADNKYKGALPIPIHFLMDEFGEPTSESTSYGDNLDYSWETDEYRIIYQYCEIFYLSYKKYNYIRYWDVSDEND